MINPAPFTWPNDWEAALPGVQGRVKFICRELGLDEEADDVFQEVSLRIWRLSKDPQSKSIINNLDDLHAWAYRSAFWLVQDMHKKQSRRDQLARMTKLPDPDVSPASAGDTSGSADLAEYLDLLPDARQREVIRLRFVERLTFKLIAEWLQEHPSTIYRLYGSAIETLTRRAVHD
jgi:RNA polymerase sigma factor (sigma-70 family)